MYRAQSTVCGLSVENQMKGIYRFSRIRQENKISVADSDLVFLGRLDLDLYTVKKWI